ncbi:protein ABHD15-like isoform X2 [Gigantopelta aegis]|nr:protein ABHD15-like isoform X2 [Gigantopelta aegis]XP_041348023.1 protein ABHD15-like isoform X2 [Gigantopelta aegis]XP_041348024.1 protein ABHD15-like isoform X2 [Gigantopelta aegis]XP_041348025.1 protein ABHD15-like isoform X2 [Gigantopelta aegis]
MLMSSIFWMLLSYPITVVLTFLSTVVLSAIVHLKSLFRPKECLPRLYFKESSLAQHVLTRCLSLRRPLRLPFWSQNAHVQTVLGLMSREPTTTEFFREYVQMPDDGVIAIDWAPGAKYLCKRNPIVIVIPGLIGNATGVAQVCHEAISNGYRACVFNRRGYGDSFLTTPTLQSYGDPSDLRSVVNFMKDRYTNSPIAVVGVGAGADLLLSYLGQFGSSSRLIAGVCVSPSYDSEDTFVNQIPKLYEKSYLMHIQSILGRYSKSFSSVIDLKAALNAKSLKDLDRHVHCPLSGCSDLEEYWENNSPMRDVDDICVPVLCFNSLDDPISVKRNIPYDIFKSYLNFFLVTTERGGHCGFVEGATGTSWTVKPAVEFITAMLEFPTKVPEPYVKNGFHSVFAR